MDVSIWRANWCRKWQINYYGGGNEDTYDLVKPKILLFKIFIIDGPCGVWPINKMVNQICIAGLVQGLMV